MTSTQFRPNLSVRSLSVSLQAQYRKRILGDSIHQYAPKDPKFTAVDKELTCSMRSAWRKRKEDREARRLAKEAVVQLSDAGKQKREQEATARKAAVKKRREILEKMIPHKRNKQISLRGLPPIQRKRKASEEHTSEEECAISIPSMYSPTPDSGAPPRKREKQSTILQYFTKN